MTKSEKQKALTELADWLEKYDAKLSYTTDDDGIHVTFEKASLWNDFKFWGTADSIREELPL